MDQWLLSRLETLTQAVGETYEAYNPTEVARLIEHFVTEELSNWYVRRNRRRFWKGEKDADKWAAFYTLRETLLRGGGSGGAGDSFHGGLALASPKGFAHLRP
jgi:isoleucyl-tRNA synthetase